VAESLIADMLGGRVGIKAVSFDFWNTLFTEPPGGFKFYDERRRQLLSDALRACGNFTDEQIARACQSEAELHLRIWREEQRTPTTAERLGRILAQLGARLSACVTAELVRAYEEGVLERPPVLVAGAREVIEQLSGRFRLGIISDVGFSPGRVLKEVLRMNKLIEAFDALVFSDEVGRSKPHTELFKKAARLLRSEPRDMVHIGDLEHTDVIGAKGAGCCAIRFIGVTPMSEDEQTLADGIAEDLREVPMIIQALHRDGNLLEIETPLPVRVV
jgi:HAD superfamily hydrolase (TIGR01549 family)